METTTIDPRIASMLIQSRQTVLDILEERGYDPLPYRNIAPDQIITLVNAGAPGALDMILKKKPDSVAPCERAAVLYTLQVRTLRHRMETFMADVYKEGVVTPADDTLVILNEPWNEIFDKTSLQMWQKEKTRITFFHIKNVVVHSGRHVLVPPHRKLNAEEAKAEMARWSVTQKSQFPLIKHSDAQAKRLGLIPGDIVEILRPSPTSGIARVLRICAA